MKKSRKITVSAIIIAIAFIFLYVASILPSAKLACLCISTACGCIIIMECGKKTGLLAGLILSILTWFFVIDKTISILYILFFSYYPLIKLFTEQKTRVVEWGIKLAYFYAITIVSSLVLGASGLIPESFAGLFDEAIMGFLAVTAIVFLECVFDYALSMVITIYIKRIMPVVNRA